MSLIAVAGTLALWACPGPAAATEPPAPDLEAGKAAYQRSCARCHGAEGHGEGLDAKRFYPRPRDLTMGIYKFRSTASGTPPTDEDLFHTITQGLPGSNMPDWQHLDEATRWQLVYYLKSLSSVFTDTKPEPVAAANDPGPKRADLAKGKAVYQDLGCAKCHGSAGRANGPSAATLVDDWGMRIRPADFTQGWSYRGGSDARSVMLRVLTGIDGAGMPSYTGAVSPEDAWHLAYYVTSLQEPPHWNPVTHALSLSGPLPNTLDDPRWEAAERTDVRLRNAVNVQGEWALAPTVKALRFQAVFNEAAIAFRFEWDDPTANRQPQSDKLALLLNPEQAQGDVVSLQAWPYAEGPTLDLCYWSADVERAQETLASSFDPVVSNQASHDSLVSAASYEDGRWRLVLQRSLHPTSPAGAAAISPDRLASVALVVWDGGNPDARAVSAWVDVDVRSPQHVAARHH